MKKGSVRVALGCVLVAFQVLSIMGNVKMGINYTLDFSNTYTFIYSALYLFGSCLVGIIGIILLVSGLFTQQHTHDEPISPAQEVSCSTESNHHNHHRIEQQDIKPTSHHKLSCIVTSLLLVLSLAGNAYLYINLIQEREALSLSVEKLQSNLSSVEKEKQKYFDQWTDSTYDLTALEHRLVVCDPENMLFHSLHCSDYTALYKIFICKYGENDCFYLDINVANQFGYSPCESCRS